MTGESARPFGVQANRSGRAAHLPPKQVENVGMQTAACFDHLQVLVLCKSWSYKPLAFQKVPLARSFGGQAAECFGMIVRNARCSSPLKGRSGATVVWQGRPSDGQKHDRPALGGAIVTNELGSGVGIGDQETQRPAICASGDCPMALTIGSQPSSRRGLGGGVPVGAFVAAGLFTALWLFTGTRGMRSLLSARLIVSVV